MKVFFMKNTHQFGTHLPYQKIIVKTFYDWFLFKFSIAV